MLLGTLACDQRSASKHPWMLLCPLSDLCALACAIMLLGFLPYLNIGARITHYSCNTVAGRFPGCAVERDDSLQQLNL
jgi:hypothetical protein